MHSLRAIPPRVVNPNPSYIDPELESAEFVFVRKDFTRSPFERHYFGPFKVAFKSDKFFTLVQNGALNNVSINRLKTAHLPLFCSDDQSEISDVQTPLNMPSSSANLHSEICSNSAEPVFRTSRIGRIIRPPAILDL